jgi:hypothetical protein
VWRETATYFRVEPGRALYIVLVFGIYGKAPDGSMHKSSASIQPGIRVMMLFRSVFMLLRR